MIIVITRSGYAAALTPGKLTSTAQMHAITARIIMGERMLTFVIRINRTALRTRVTDTLFLLDPLIAT